MFCAIGYYDDIEGCTFGTIKKGVRRPLSNFNFTFKGKVIASVPSSTGYLVDIFPESLDKVTDDSDNEEVTTGLVCII